MFALAFLSSVRAYRHIPEDGVTFYTFNCGNENWCGVDQGNGLVDSSYSSVLDDNVILLYLTLRPCPFY